MNDQVQEQRTASGGADNAKLIAAAVLVLAGIAGYYMLAAKSDWIRWAAVVAGVALGAVVFASSERGRTFWQFGLDSRIELRKVVWPSRQETGTTTAVVFGFVIIAGLFFWLLDFVLSWATKILSGQGG
jgi:preprotein translocase subunit SecE